MFDPFTVICICIESLHVSVIFTCLDEHVKLEHSNWVHGSLLCTVDLCVFFQFDLEAREDKTNTFTTRINKYNEILTMIK